MKQVPIPALLRRDAVLLLTGFTAGELQSEIDNGLFPPPVKLSPDNRAMRSAGTVARLAR